VAGDAGLFENSSMRVDRTRFEHDGWISVIGQHGKTVRVVDYWPGDPASSAERKASE
jgi:hypothetical protein